LSRSPAGKWLGLVFAILLPLTLLWQYYPLADASARLSALPLKAALVECQNLPLTGAEQATFANVTVVKRLVVAQAGSVILTLIDGTHDRHAVHDPTFCFRGAGWEVGAAERVPLAKGSARLLHLRNGGEAAEALYWFTDGNQEFARPLLYWWKTTLRRLTFGASGPEPLLVVLVSANTTPPNWPALLKAWPELQSL
jgi:hypothetical protein